MSSIFVVIILIGIIGLIIGLKNPEKVKMDSKKKVAKIYIPIIIGAFILFGVTTDLESDKEGEVAGETTEKEPEEEENEKESVSLENKENKIKEDEGEDNEENSENNVPEELDENLDEEENTTFSQEELEDLSLSILEDNFKEMARVDFNREQKEFLITSIDPAFDEELLYMIEHDVVLDDWNFLVDSFTYMSESIYNLLGSGYTLQLVNPFNEENTLLSIVDGYVIYNAFE